MLRNRVLMFNVPDLKYYTPVLTYDTSGKACLAPDKNSPAIDLLDLHPLPPQITHDERGVKYGKGEWAERMSSRFSELFLQYLDPGATKTPWGDNPNLHLVVSPGHSTPAMEGFVWYSNLGLYLPRGSA